MIPNLLSQFPRVKLQFNQGCPLGAFLCHRLLPFAPGRLENSLFSNKLKCWAPRISWLETFGLLKIFVRPHPRVSHQYLTLKMAEKAQSRRSDLSKR